MKKIVMLLLVAGGFFLMLAEGMGVSLRASSAGVGLEGKKMFNEKLGARVGVSMITTQNFSGSTGNDDNPLDYDFDLNMVMVSALVDYHVFGGGFHITGGLYYNGLSGEGEAMSGKDYKIGDRVYTPERLGVISIDYAPENSINPYLGIGYSNTFESGFGFVFDLGTMYMGSPDITMDADKDSMIYPSTEQDKDIEEDLADLKFYPVMSFGVSYNF